MEEKKREKNQLMIILENLIPREFLHQEERECQTFLYDLAESITESAILHTLAHIGKREGKSPSAFLEGKSKEEIESFVQEHLPEVRREIVREIAHFIYSIKNNFLK